MKILTAAIAILFFQASLTAQTSNNNISLSNPFFLPAEKTIFYKLGDKNIPIRILQYGNVKNIICVNLHDNETTSVQAAMSVLEKTGGTLIKIENKQQRIIRFRLKGITYSFDPNRVFSRAGIEQTLRENRRINHNVIDEVEKFAQRILQLIPDGSSCIIALHNNTEEAFSIRSYLPGNNREADARAVYADSLQDVDDIALTTDSILYQKMADNGYNSIWQDNEKAKKDGSLSIYYGERNKRYINIETQHGKVAQYINMLQKLMTILADKNKELPETTDNSE